LDQFFWCNDENLRLLELREILLGPICTAADGVYGPPPVVSLFIPRIIILSRLEISSFYPRIHNSKFRSPQNPSGARNLL
jgi:hypothetical protein